MTTKNYSAVDIVKTRNALIQSGTPKKPFSLDPTPFSEKVFDFARFSAPVRRQPSPPSPPITVKQQMLDACARIRPAEFAFLFDSCDDVDKC